MKCPTCGVKAPVSETRTDVHGNYTRRRLCPNGHHFTTFELLKITNTEFRNRQRAFVREASAIVVAATKMGRGS